MTEPEPEPGAAQAARAATHMHADVGAAAPRAMREFAESPQVRSGMVEPLY